MWDATCLDTYAPSHVSTAAREPGAVAAQAEHLKMTKYSHLESGYLFVLFAIETSGVLGLAAWEFVNDLGWRLHYATGEPRSKECLLQRLSVAIQRGNAVAIQRGNVAAVLGTAGKNGELDPFWGVTAGCMYVFVCVSSQLFIINYIITNVKWNSACWERKEKGEKRKTGNCGTRTQGV